MEAFGDNGSHHNPVTLTGSQRESSQDKPSSGSHSPSGLLLYANVFGRKPTKYGQRNKELSRSENDPLVFTVMISACMNWAPVAHYFPISMFGLNLHSLFR